MNRRLLRCERSFWTSADQRKNTKSLLAAYERRQARAPLGPERHPLRHVETRTSVARQRDGATVSPPVNHARGGRQRGRRSAMEYQSDFGDSCGADTPTGTLGARRDRGREISGILRPVLSTRSKAPANLSLGRRCAVSRPAIRSVTQGPDRDAPGTVCQYHQLSSSGSRPESFHRRVEPV